MAGRPAARAPFPALARACLAPTRLPVAVKGKGPLSRCVCVCVCCHGAWTLIRVCPIVSFTRGWRIVAPSNLNRDAGFGALSRALLHALLRALLACLAALLFNLAFLRCYLAISHRRPGRRAALRKHDGDPKYPLYAVQLPPPRLRHSHSQWSRTHPSPPPDHHHLSLSAPRKMGRKFMFACWRAFGTGYT